MKVDIYNTDKNITLFMQIHRGDLVKEYIEEKIL